MRCSALIFVLSAALQAAEPAPVLLARLGNDRFRIAENGGRSLAISPDGLYVAVATSSQVYCFDGRTGQRFTPYRGNIMPFALVVTNEGVVSYLEGDASGALAASAYSIPQQKRLRCVSLPIPDQVNVNRYVISPDGRTLATILQSGGLMLYDGETGRLLNRLPLTHTNARARAQDGIQAVFSADSGRLAVCANDGKETAVTVIERKSAAAVFSRKIAIDVDELALSADGAVLAFTTQKNLSVYRTATAEHLRTQAYNGSARALAVAASGEVSLYDEDTNDLRIYDPKSRAPRKIPIPVEVDRACFSANNKLMAVLSEDGALLLYDAATGKKLPQSADLMTAVRDLHCTANGRLVGFAGGWISWDRSTVLRLGPAYFPWPDPRGMGRLRETSTERGWVLSPDGLRVACQGNGGRVSLYDAETGKLLQAQSKKPPIPKATQRQRGSMAIWFAADGKLVSDLGSTDTVYSMEFNGPSKVHSKLAKFPNGEVFARVPSPDGKLLLSFCLNGPTHGFCGFALHEPSTGKLRYIKPLSGYMGTAAFTPDGSRFAVNSFKLNEHRQYSLISVHESSSDQWSNTFSLPYTVTALAMSPDGRTVAFNASLIEDDIADFGGADVILCEAVTGKERARLKGVSAESISSIAFAPDGRSIAVAADDGTIGLWDIDKPYVPANASLEQLWKNLVSADAAVAYRGVRGLLAQPAAALKLLGEKLPPEAKANAASVAKNISLLASPVFAERDRATRDLAAVADRIVPALREASASTASEEARQRLESLLAESNRLTPEGRRGTRAVEVAEALALSGKAEAKKLLQTWAAGVEGPVLTREAKMALSRVK